MLRKFCDFAISLGFLFTKTVVNPRKPATRPGRRQAITNSDVPDICHNAERNQRQRTLNLGKPAGLKSTILTQLVQSCIIIFSDGTAGIDTCSRQRFGYSWDHLLVCPIGATDMAKLPDEEYRRPSGCDDFDMVDIRCALRCVRNGATVQRTPDHSATMLLRAVWR